MARSVRLKDHAAEKRLFGRRIIAATLVITFCASALIARLAYLQILRHDYFTELSQGNRIRIDPLPPSRGLIYDRNGVALALNRPAYQLEVIREQTPDIEDTLRRLIALQLLPVEDLERTRRAINAGRTFDVVPIRLQLSEEELARFAVNRPYFPGVEVRPRLTRYYPNVGSAVHALGYVAAISEKDQATIDVPNYAGTTLIGKLGIERAFEDELHGETGYQQMLVNAQGRLVERVGVSAPDLVRHEPTAGNDLYLAIDERVQRTAEEALAGHRAAVIAIDPRNGDVVAYVSTPMFDPNGFARGLKIPEYAALQGDVDRPLYDRAMRGVYPPGSTIKPLVALAALENDVIAPETTRACHGAFQLPGSSHQFRDWKKGGHGTIDMHRAIVQSCDVYFYGVASSMGIDRLHDFLTRFGLGSATGIDIGGERTGLVPSPAWKKQAFKRPESQVWFPGETVIAGIGQGYVLVTPLQLAEAAATIAMRGQRYAPRLVKKIRNARTGEIVELAPKALPTVKLKDPAHWDVIISGMIGVTNEPGGTARASQAGAPYKIAGKTGTAQVFSVAQNEKYNEKDITERMRDHALFIAFAPADAPRLAVAVLVENGRHGSSAAAPIARKVFDAYLLPPDEASKPAENAAATPPTGGNDE